MDIKEIVQRCKKNDESAKEELLMAFKGFIYKNSKLINLTDYDREDLLQEGFLSIMKSLKMVDLDKPGSIVTYICNSIRFNYNYLIRQKCRNNSELSLNAPIEDNLEVMDTLQGKEDVEAHCLQREISYEVNKAVRDSLDSEERDLIEFLFFREGKLKDYCDRKNINYNLCAKRKERALKKMRIYMDKKFKYTLNK